MDDEQELGTSRLKGPAIGLIATSSIWILLLLLGLCFSVFLLVSGAADEMIQPAGMSKRTQIMVRMVSNLAMQALNIAILWGGIQILRRKATRGQARLACILALIPCCGPCFVLGIPFGIWGLVALNDPETVFPDEQSERAADVFD